MIPTRHSLRLLVLLLSVSAIVLLIGCTPSHPQSTFDPAGEVADKQLTLLWIILGAAIVVFVPTVGVLVYAVIRYRRRPGEDEIPAQTHGNTRLEIAWTIAPGIVLAVIAVPTIIYIFEIDEASDPDALGVNVTGHQWWWEFEIPEYNLITANELHVPVNRQIKLNLRSDDVIHSFWIPKLAGKVDVVPGNVNPMNFTSKFVGEFYGQCAEFCGVAHAHMRFRVIVQSQFEFDKWVAKYHEIAKRGPPTGDTREARGFTVFASRGCLLCHKSDGPASLEVREALRDAFESGALLFPAPNLTNFGTRTTMAAGIMELNRESIIEWLTDPDKVKPGNRMAQLAITYVDPNASLSDQDIQELADYLLSLK